MLIYSHFNETPVKWHYALSCLIFVFMCWAITAFNVSFTTLYMNLSASMSRDDKGTLFHLAKFMY